MSINRGNFDHSKLANPRVVGTGCWKTLHYLAVFDDEREQSIYPDFLRYFCERFKCKECRSHALAYLKRNPPERYKGQAHGMSKHSFDFHNEVNRSNGKPALDWETFIKLFINEDDEGICNKGCDKAEKRLSSEELSEVNFNRIKHLAREDSSLVQVRKEGKYRRS